MCSSLKSAFFWRRKHLRNMGEMKLKWYMSPSAGRSHAAEPRLLLTNTLSQLCALAKSSFLFAQHCFNLDAEDLCLWLLSPWDFFPPSYFHHQNDCKLQHLRFWVSHLRWSLQPSISHKECFMYHFWMILAESWKGRSQPTKNWIQVLRPLPLTV